MSLFSQYSIKVKAIYNVFSVTFKGTPFSSLPLRKTVQCIDSKLFILNCERLGHEILLQIIHGHFHIWFQYCVNSPGEIFFCVFLAFRRGKLHVVVRYVNLFCMVYERFSFVSSMISLSFPILYRLFHGRDRCHHVGPSRK